jgi:hypothetical protein
MVFHANDAIAKEINNVLKSDVGVDNIDADTSAAALDTALTVLDISKAPPLMLNIFDEYLLFPLLQKKVEVTVL